MNKLYAVTKTDKPPRQRAREAVRAYRELAAPLGSLVGERVNHRGWPEDVTLAFCHAKIVRPAQGDIQKRLYGKSKGDHR